ncbi:MAG: glycosyltransferase N-terminal domain-containing protein [Bacteroidales bacterium]|nr:glycosyltransferase N-terminal domain-containing protein [Bacteroidales bacterium]
MLFLYQIGIRILYLVILIASPFSRRASQWISGRRENASRLSSWKADKNYLTLWMHVSSLGEFEQGRPVLERWKKECPDARILLSFYSPSGFNIRKDYPLADLVFYLPNDTKKKMSRLLDQLNPDLFVLVKYDFWPNLLQTLNQRKIPAFLISARFREDQYLFKSWGRVFLQQLRSFKWVFVQDEDSAALLRKYHFEQVLVAGDTRVDAVMSADRKPLNHDHVPVLIGGSTWPPEEKLLAQLWRAEEFKPLRESWSLIIAPHDISEEHLCQIEGLFESEIIRHSRIEGPLTKALGKNSLILIDSIGLLSSLYSLANLAFIGGGFGKGIHNTLEPAAYGLPVIFGPNWTKFREAGSMISAGAAFPVKDYDEFSAIVKKMCSDSNFRAESGNLALNYMKSQMGSSDLIIRYLLGKC